MIEDERHSKKDIIKYRVQKSKELLQEIHFSSKKYRLSLLILRKNGNFHPYSYIDSFSM